MSESSKSIRLDEPVQYLKGIGPKRAGLLERAGVLTVRDLLDYFPRRYLDRSRIAKIHHLRINEQVTIIGDVLSTEMVQGKRKRFVVWVGDGTGMLQCTWFQGHAWVSKQLNKGEKAAFSGKVTFYRGPQMVHPEYDILTEDGHDPMHTAGIIPLYPSTESLTKGGLDSRGFRRVLHPLVMNHAFEIPETLPQSILDEKKLLPADQAIRAIHFPENQTILQKAVRRLKFEELFYIQLFLASQRETRHLEKKGIVFEQVGDSFKALLDKLPFDLTEAQKRALREIRQDMKSPAPMNRLIQGDVGSGKTIVALLAMMIAVANGYQAAFMAPTEILAEQHYLTVHKWLESFNLRVGLLTGSQKSAQRSETLAALESGGIDIIVGTHALVQEGVTFKQLGLLVIDEQHRFGVLQRAALREKGQLPDVLVMTATPIPRTLALTLYGDLDVSVIDEKPANRQNIRTVWRKDNKRPQIYEYIRSEVNAGRQAYIIYPLVEESEKIDLAAATEGYETLSKDIFPEFTCGLLHGRMKPDEKEAAMSAFKANEVQILISTTVIEVGIDVPNATIMLIEHAERFGLTQLHQLRGRVGRGKHESLCILLSGYAVSEDAEKRLGTMERTHDGFEISEIDLEIRGPGELFGTRQSGLLNLKIASLVTDGAILEEAKKAAIAVIADDPKLEKESHQILKKTVQEKHRHFGLIEVG